MCFICEFFKTIRNIFFIDQLWTATSILGKNLKHFTVYTDLAKYLTTLTVITDFGDNIWNSGVATKQSENPI